MTNRPRAASGILLINKPAGITSAGVVARIKHAFGGIKVGHLGTLDPFATGLLPLCLGEGTKAAPYLNLADKEYTGVVRLGLTTDTLDITGETLGQTSPPDPQGLDLPALGSLFTGDIEQVPPAFSAIKRDGVPMYRLARQGRAPELEARRVRIYRLALKPLPGARLELKVHCSKGTYIRSLARDIGQRIGCGATLESLERTAFGRFHLAQAAPLPAAEQAAGARKSLLQAVIPLASALSELRALRVDAATAERLRRGRQEALTQVARPRAEGENARILDCEEGLVAVVSAQGGRWRLARVFAASASCAP